MPAHIRLQFDPILSSARPSIHITKVIENGGWPLYARFDILWRMAGRDLERKQIGLDGTHAKSG